MESSSSRLFRSFVALASERTTQKNTETKKKRITKRIATPGFTGVTVRLELQIGEIPLRFSGISLFGRSKEL